MRCPTLKELPSPLKEKMGWPWTEESKQLSDQMPDGRAWPRITIVTPSFNQGVFIEETIRSVLLQGYPNLEYIVLDGASTDNSVEIIKKYEPWLSYWMSEPDSGQSDAINRGLKMGSGLFATWINSDDLLEKEALFSHGMKAEFNEREVYVGLCSYVDQMGNYKFTRTPRVHSLNDLLSVEKVWRSGGNIVQPEVLFPRSLFFEVGGLNLENHYTMDYELWGKFLLAEIPFRYTGIKFARARNHSQQKTADGYRQTRAMLKTAAKLVEEAHHLPKERKAEIHKELCQYWDTWEKTSWKDSGRLAKLGLSPMIVTLLRKITAQLIKR
ncbi:MAG TPA: glycosyltransferase family 2 protein [Nitrospirales bacterium]|nr:glycosyltransferase [Nitrospiraceae bacterium]HNP28725.1 glycosyltransferase family 2 protein [Nitrospirales bacterium]